MIRIALVVSTLIVSLVVGAPAEAVNERRTIMAVDGMMIDMHPDHLQQLRIRLQSFGPGLCHVRVRFAGQVLDLSAPPFTWSNWSIIGPAMIGGSHTLSISPQCSTGAMAEVSYVVAPN